MRFFIKNKKNYFLLAVDDNLVYNVRVYGMLTNGQHPSRMRQKKFCAEEEEIKMSERIEDMDNIVKLEDEDGKEMEFEFLDLVEYENREFVVLLPMEEDAEEVVILEVIPCEDDEEMEEYVSIESEELLNAVFEVFKEKNKEEFSFDE